MSPTAPAAATPRRGPRWRWLAAFVVLALLLVGLVVELPQPVRFPCPRSAKLVPACGVLWGSYQHPGSGQTWVTAQTDAETQVGRAFDISYHYHDFSGPSDENGTIPTSYEKTLAASGHIIFDDWAPQVFTAGTTIPWAQIAAGDYDASVVIPIAQSIKSWGQPMMLSIDHEMDAQVGSLGTAADYVAMYRHIHAVFASHGVTNVVWVWTTTGYGGRRSTFNSLYPGNSYVDWVGYDPYNLDTCLNPHGSWRTPQQVIDPMYRWLEANGYGDKPFILPEYGTVADPGNGSGAADWYRQLPAVLVAHPDIKAAIQWNSSFQGCNIHLDAQPGEIAAFAAAGRTRQMIGWSS